MIGDCKVGVGNGLNWNGGNVGFGRISIVWEVIDELVDMWWWWRLISLICEWGCGEYSFRLLVGWDVDRVVIGGRLLEESVICKGVLVSSLVRIGCCWDVEKWIV